MQPLLLYAVCAAITASIASLAAATHPAPAATTVAPVATTVATTAFAPAGSPTGDATAWGPTVSPTTAHAARVASFASPALLAGVAPSSDGHRRRQPRRHD